VLDAIDRHIVAELQAAPRLRVAELSRRIGLSGPAVADRLRRLEEDGILAYRAEVNPRALGYTIFAIVRISPTNGGLRLIPGIAREVPNVTECYRITGEDCYFMKVTCTRSTTWRRSWTCSPRTVAPRPRSCTRRRCRPARCPYPGPEFDSPVTGERRISATMSSLKR
jgi:DNA-binding Lrp family transcriptional regulator